MLVNMSNKDYPGNESFTISLTDLCIKVRRLLEAFFGVVVHHCGPLSCHGFSAELVANCGFPIPESAHLLEYVLGT